MDFELNFDSFDDFEGEKGKAVEECFESDQQYNKARRRTEECTELSKGYEYRRCYSEVHMLDAMKHVRLQEGYTYNFITGGDTDSLSYLKVVLNQHNLDYLLLSAWCMLAEDVLQIIQWFEEGRIKRLDMYLGRLFKKTYRVEWRMIKKFYDEHPGVGRAIVFRNNSKTYAGYNEAENFYFGIQTSANINTNPNTEQGSITISRGIFDFYKGFFDSVMNDGPEDEEC